MNKRLNMVFGAVCALALGVGLFWVGMQYGYRQASQQAQLTLRQRMMNNVLGTQSGLGQTRTYSNFGSGNAAYDQMLQQYYNQMQQFYGQGGGQVPLATPTPSTNGSF